MLQLCDSLSVKITPNQSQEYHQYSWCKHYKLDFLNLCKSEGLRADNSTHIMAGSEKSS